jgi:hypothetical protein
MGRCLWQVGYAGKWAGGDGLLVHAADRRVKDGVALFNVRNRRFEQLRCADLTRLSQRSEAEAVIALVVGYGVARRRAPGGT